MAGWGPSFPARSGKPPSYCPRIQPVRSLCSSISCNCDKDFDYQPLQGRRAVSPNGGYRHRTKIQISNGVTRVVIPELYARDEQEHQNGILNWLNRLFRREATCYEDSYYNFVQDLGPDFCYHFVTYPNVTTTVDYTPTRFV